MDNKAAAERIREAISTMRKLPPVTVQGYFNTWPYIKRTEVELLLMEAGPIRLKATPDAIARLEEVLKWMRWLTVEERKIVWMHGARMSWKSICWEFGLSPAGASGKWRRALTKIVDQLNSKI
jgi:hypothetical protein